jgi:hypothetical protein
MFSVPLDSAPPAMQEPARPVDGTCGMCGSCGSCPPWSPDALAGASPAQRDAVDAALASARARFVADRDTHLLTPEVFVTPRESPSGPQVGAESDGGQSTQPSDGDAVQPSLDVPNFALGASATDVADVDTVDHRHVAALQIVDPDGWPEDSADLEEDDFGGTAFTDVGAAPPPTGATPEIETSQGQAPQSLQDATSADQEDVADYSDTSDGDTEQVAQVATSDVSSLEESVCYRRLQMPRRNDMQLPPTPEPDPGASGSGDGFAESPVGADQPLSPSHVEVSLKSPQMQPRTFPPAPFSYHEHCEQCQKLKVRIEELEQHKDALESALEARAMASVSLRAKGVSPKSKSSSRLREEVDNLRFTVDFCSFRVLLSLPLTCSRCLTLLLDLAVD